ncbi:ras-like protein [Conidiobolus coronatus NRRL 28638]|uniref:small monomeric GTPase n=1 Tax=Conidiobolus coronatus (strain ATCC 28846 / CBS 209.66 / NRRL 28638) TaxID=796925 RepID=A0A137P0E1_CONC2|nr:ras-like protein [Conidiobolus coronatus NRRL 28638]|eukprot:KXN68515.1 ras-like protein [Conidiobolus coronatus NRRL 28638]
MSSYLSTPKFKEYKITLLGIGGAGKSAITIQFIRSQFVEEYDPTIEDSYNKQCVIDQEVCDLEILDTAGQEEYNAMRDQYIRSGHGFIIVYSIDQLDSFKEAISIYQRICIVKESRKVPIVLVGNKCDLEEQRRVTKYQAELMAKNWNCPIFETSAKFRINIDEAFHELCRLIRRDRHNSASVPSSADRSFHSEKLIITNEPRPLVDNTSEEEEVNLLGCCIIM